jgi:hypothetical protein
MVNAQKIVNMISAAAETTRPETPVPRWTAGRVWPFLVNSSLILETT